MDLTWKMVLIVPVGVFLASIVDGIAGGGGMISLPAYFLAGLPAHLALGTNKLSACLGTSVSAGRFIGCAVGGAGDHRILFRYKAAAGGG